MRRRSTGCWRWCVTCSRVPTDYHEGVRRVLLFLVVGGLVAALAGLGSRSSAVVVNGRHVSTTELNAGLVAIEHHPTARCFFSSLVQNSLTPGSGGDTISMSATSAWTSLQVQGLAIANYVTARYHYHPSSGALATAETSLEQELTQQAARFNLVCPGTPAQALAELPASVRTTELVDQADSFYFLAKVKSTVPLTTASLRAYYQAHRSAYESICLSVALVPSAKTASFLRAEHRNSVRALVRAYSIDKSRTHGGAIGCVTPSSSAYSAIAADVKGLALKAWSAPFSYNSGKDALFLTATSRPVASFASVESSILTTLRASNASAAAQVSNDLLYLSSVRVDPSLGSWVAAVSGSTVHPAFSPLPTLVDGGAQLVSASPATYH